RRPFLLSLDSAGRADRRTADRPKEHRQGQIFPSDQILLQPIALLCRSELQDMTHTASTDSKVKARRKRPDTATVQGLCPDLLSPPAHRRRLYNHPGPGLLCSDL